MIPKSSLIFSIFLSVMVGVTLGFIFVSFCPFLQDMLIDINECYFIIP
jgi:hypothetical protein